MSVPEAASSLGVSRSRIMQMIARGELEAEKVANRWIIEPSSLPARRRPAGRPMSQRVAWAFALEDSSWLGPDEAYRLRQRVRQWRDSPDPLPQLRAWLASRAPAQHLSASDLQSVMADERLVRSGVSDQRSGMSAGVFVEGYVHQDDAEDFRRAHLLVPAPRARANVVLRLSPLDVPQPASQLLVIADLADCDGPREYARARVLLEEWMAGRPSSPRWR